MTSMQIIALGVLPFALWAIRHILCGPVRGKSPNYSNAEWAAIQRQILRAVEAQRQAEYSKHSEGYRKAHEND